MKILYYTATLPQEKLSFLIRTVTRHFHLGEKIQIVAKDMDTLAFVSQLLWQKPKQAFLPHSVGKIEPFQDRIFLCLPSQISDVFPFLFNLCPTPLSCKAEVLYEIEDLSSPDKKQTFQEKFHFYQALHIPIICGSKI